ncbi:hypothetical protein PMI30_03406 [Pseudomonas sp. GM50]|nr:hypothetical protein PMI30_03406 [Pseudomonas sp. GM50]
MVMTSYIFNSDTTRKTRMRRASLYLLTGFMVLGAGLVVELIVRRSNSVLDSNADLTPVELMSILPRLSIEGRENGNQMLVQNVALFSQNPNPEQITTGYVGTSRSKVLRPSLFGLQGTMLGAGNSYNEITYGLLLQAEILRLSFPNIKRVYFETSFLLRRPNRLILEDDHRKYLPLLSSFSSLCDKDREDSGCKPVFRMLESLKNSNDLKFQSELLAKRSSLRISALWSKSREAIKVADDPLLASLSLNGERRSLPKTRMADVDQTMIVTNESAKIQGIRDISTYGTGDSLFNMIALWGRDHGIQIVFFQPPVRTDYYKFEVQYGLKEHLADITSISGTYKIPFINLDQPGLGFMEDTSLFSDEDHMETCWGSGLLTLAIDRGFRQYESQGDLMPRVTREEIESDGAKMVSICH